LAQRNLYFALVFTFLLFSVAGIPPLAGFYSKLCVLLALMSKDFIVITMIVAVFSSIACFYYIRLIKIFFFTEQAKNSFWLSGTSRSIELFLSFSTSLVILFLCRPVAFLTDLGAIVAMSLL
jgi:NADH-quinone oxidoreductase subunit N